MAICLDPRGPLVDRPDFIEGQIDVLQRLVETFEHDELSAVLGDPRFVEVRETLDATFVGNTPTEQFAAELEISAMELESKLRDELTLARRKLAQLRQAEVQS